jgi:2-keto-4-pentenoate hydratase/2-oxohepta-3-ene-1,7-dioic acid hydratase in catechol pathway
MRLATVAWNGSSSAALVVGDKAAPARNLRGRDDALDVASLIREPLVPDEVEILAAKLRPLEGERLLPPILRPPKNLLCVGKNYVEHVEEGARAEGVRAEVPKAPIWFSKPHTALVGCGADVVCDESFTRELDYEGELAVVIGRGGRNIAPEEALANVYGYTVLNDLTARDVQQSRNQWFKGKSADTYAPLGPVVVTADEVPDYRALRVRTVVDGEVRQEDSAANMIFDVPALIADISRGLTLEPGDVIGTGTPSGVAWGMDEPGYLEPGSVVSVEIEGIGMLWNRVVASS